MQNLERRILSCNDAKPDRLDRAGMGGHLKRRKRKQDIHASELENVTVSSAFDWDRLPLHLETIYADLKQLPWILLEPGSSQGKVVHDPFGKTIHGTNSPLHIGQVYRIGEAGMELALRTSADVGANPARLLSRRGSSIRRKEVGEKQTLLPGTGRLNRHAPPSVAVPLY